MKRTALSAGILVVLALGFGLVHTRSIWWPGPQSPLSRSTSPVTFPGENPFGGHWTAIEVFPGVTFVNPVAIVEDRRAAGTYFVAQKEGQLLAVKAGPPAQAIVALDLRDRVETGGEAGLVGLVLHPMFGDPTAPSGRFVYVFYVARGGDKMFDRLSRFRIAEDGLVTDPTSEFVMIDQLDEDTDHNAGNLQFGPDGFLYVGVGDEGGIADQFGNAQHIDRDLFSGILRIDVDCRPGVSHPIGRQPQTGRTQGYCIPNDNPFVGMHDVLEEFWAIGFRNPHRFSFDETGLWGGDVGQNLREKVFLATKGSNHQWSYREGTIPFSESPLHGQPPDPLIGTETAPVFDYPHTNGNGAVIGGYVYRGTQFPELDGKYLFGDYNSGLVWALETPALTGVAGVPKLQTLMRLPPDRRIASFGVDRLGELLICGYGKRSTILKLSRRPD